MSLHQRQPREFHLARPIWPRGMEKEMNLHCGFRAVFRAGENVRAELRITASSVYRAYLNGRHVGYGPARAAQGWFRIDSWDLSPALAAGDNILAIEAAGYNVNCGQLSNQPAFLQAEALVDGEAIAATGMGPNQFQAAVLPERIRKTPRFNPCRAFQEAYRMGAESNLWRRETMAPFRPLPCSVFDDKKYLPRGVANPDFSLRAFQHCSGCGKVQKHRLPGKEKIWRSLPPVDKTRFAFGFAEEELECDPVKELQGLKTQLVELKPRPLAWGEPIHLPADSYCILDLGANLAGFPGLEVVCRRAGRLFFVFDEIISAGDVDFKRGNGFANVILFCLEEPGRFTLEAFEPSCLRYLKLIAEGMDCEIINPYLREYANSEVWRAHFSAPDVKLVRLFEGGRESFRQNSVDLFIDLPSREYTAWLGDSFFTAQVAFELSGNTRVEKNFFENYLLPADFPGLPEGMLPMRYPADHSDGSFIPNWAMWFVIQFEEYFLRSGDKAMVEAMKPRIMRLFDYFRRFQNKEGLLEKLEKWIFVDFSASGGFTQDVNFPTNMVYAGALAAAGRLYNSDDLLEEGRHVLEAVRKFSFDGEFFVDNAVREGDKLEPTGNRSEACQYYAFYFNAATPESHPALWRMLCEHFGPGRKQGDDDPFSEIHRSSVFLGYLLRFELLSRYGLDQQLINEATAYWSDMVERTGTAGADVCNYLACSAGCTSRVAHLLYRNVLGIWRIDPLQKKVYLRFPDVNLAWCEGRLPLPEGDLALSWWKENSTLFYKAIVPAGWTLKLVGNPKCLTYPEKLSFSGLNTMRMDAVLSNDQGRPAIKVVLKSFFIQPVSGRIKVIALPGGMTLADAGNDYVFGPLAQEQETVVILPVEISGEVRGDLTVRLEAGGREQCLRKEIKVITSQKTDKPLKIDGGLKGKGWPYPAALDNREQICYGRKADWKGKEELSALVYSRWDENNLYFGIDVKDQQLMVYPDLSGLWNAGSVEFFFDTGEGENIFDNDYTGRCAHLIFAPACKDYPLRIDIPWPGRGKEMNRERIEAASRLTADGYQMEIRIPVRELGLDRLNKGKIIGFNVSINNAELFKGKIKRRHLMTWNGKSEVHHDRRQMESLVCE